MSSMNDDMPICYFCLADCPETDFCSGCDVYICEKCDKLPQMGDHIPEDHNDEY